MFPSFSDLQFLNSFGALTQAQVNMYVKGGAITADQAKQLGFSASQQTTSTNTTPQSNQAANSDNAAQQSQSSSSASGKPSPVAKSNSAVNN